MGISPGAGLYDAGSVTSPVYGSRPEEPNKASTCAANLRVRGLLAELVPVPYVMMSTQNPLSNSAAGNAFAPAPGPTVSPDSSSSKKKWVVAAVLGGLLVLLAAAIAGYGFYFKDRALPGTTVAGKPVTAMKASQIEQQVAQNASQLAVRISGDATKTAPLSELGYAVDSKKTAERALASSHSFGQRLKGLFSPAQVRPAFSQTPGKVGEFASHLLGGKDNTPVNAKVVLAEDGSAFRLQSGKPGRGINPDQIDAAAQKAINTLSLIHI